METDLIISTINELHKKTNNALENKDAETYTSILDESFVYSQFDGTKIGKKEYFNNIEKYFRRVKRIETSQYRIKYSFQNETFIEKIARKSIIIKPRLLVLSKKQTIQTEEIFHWRNINNDWKVIAVEVVLEEKY